MREIQSSPETRSSHQLHAGGAPERTRTGPLCSTRGLLTAEGRSPTTFPSAEIPSQRLTGGSAQAVLNVGSDPGEPETCGQNIRSLVEQQNNETLVELREERSFLLPPSIS